MSLETDEKVEDFIRTQAAEVPGSQVQWSRLVLIQLSSRVKLRGFLPFSLEDGTQSAQRRKQRRPGALKGGLVYPQLCCDCREVNPTTAGRRGGSRPGCAA